MATSVLSMVLETKKRGTGGADVTRELQGVTKGLANAALAVGAVAGGLFVAQRVYRATVGEAMEYADAVGDLASITGESTENTSRFMTVLGDFGIEMSQITAAGRAMRDEGLAPTLGTLAQLSDQYLALAPGMDRVNFLQETFGRGGAEFVDVLEQGSAAIMARSAAVAAGNVLTAEEARQADALKLSLAELNTSWENIVRTLSFGVIPVLGDLARGINEALQPPPEGGGIVGWLQNIFIGGLEHSLGYVEDLTGGVGDLTGALNGVPRIVPVNLLFSTNFAQFIADNPELRYLIASGLLGGGAGYSYTGTTPITPWQTGGGGGGGGGGGAYGPPGGWAAWAALHPGEFWTPGAAYGADFVVGGPAGVDRVPVGFMATAGERVTVQTAEQQRRGGGGPSVHFHGPIHLGGDLDLAKFEKMLVRCLRG
jgi:hypothetical protein